MNLHYQFFFSRDHFRENIHHHHSTEIGLYLLERLSIRKYKSLKCHCKIELEPIKSIREI